MLIRLIAATASIALLAGAASAQSSAPAAGDVSSQPLPADTSAAPDNASAPAVNAATPGYNSRVGASADNGAAAPTVPASSSALGDPTNLKAGDPGVVSNGPVADTPENRAKYGRPDSHAGTRTAPAGN